MNNDARMRLAETLSALTQRDFTVQDKHIIDIYDDEGHFFTHLDKEALEILSKETQRVSAIVDRAMQLVILLSMET